jgi:hypothetical protein
MGIRKRNPAQLVPTKRQQKPACRVSITQSMSAGYKFNRKLILVHPAAETWTPSIEANRRIFAMSRNLKIAMVAAMLAFAATGIGVYSQGLQIKGYGCLAHPDYGLYTPHFC